MKLRTFLASLVAMVATPWKRITGNHLANLERVYPEPSDDLRGLVIGNDKGPKFIIGELCPDEFEWMGQKCNNYWKNKCYAYQFGGPRTEATIICLICLDPVFDRMHGPKFWRIT